VGRPDGRMFSFTKTEAAVILATKQMSFVENLGQMPEVMSLGCNPHYDHNVYAHIALPSARRPKFVDEFLYSQLLERQKLAEEGSDITPRKFLKGLQSSLKRSKAKGAGLTDNTALGGVLGLEALMDMSNSMTASSDGLQKMIKMASSEHLTDSGSHHHDNHHNHHAGHGDLLPHGTSMEGLSAGDINVFQSNLDARTGRFLGRFQLSQRLLEARFNSLERFVSFCVMFHASAECVNHDLWGLWRWDISRSQSHMRINTTACPVMDTLTDLEDSSQGNSVGGNSSIARAAKLKEVQVFSLMSGPLLELVSTKCTVAHFPAGSKVVKQGDAGDCLFVVESGQAVLVLEKENSHPREVGQCNVGDHFGEAALTRDDYKQPVSVVAVTALKVLKLSKASLVSCLSGLAPNTSSMNQSMDGSSSGRPKKKKSNSPKLGSQESVVNPLAMNDSHGSPGGKKKGVRPTLETVLSMSEGDFVLGGGGDILEEDN
jgi:hypothetical protein